MFSASLFSSGNSISGTSPLEFANSQKRHGKNVLLMARRESDLFTFLVGDGQIYPYCIEENRTTVVRSSNEVLEKNWSGYEIWQAVAPVFVLRALKIVFSTLPENGVQDGALKDFYTLLNHSQEVDAPGLIWTKCDNEEFFFFCPGNGQAIDQVVDMAAGELVADPVLVYNLFQMHCDDMQYAYFPYRDQIDIWQEYRLHRYFCEISEAVLRRYNDLTGRVMVQMLARSVNHFAIDQGWQVEIRMGTMVDCLALTSLKECRAAYQSILKQMLEQVAVSIGDKLVGLILSDYLNNAPHNLQDEIMSLLPQKYPLTLTGRTKR